MEKDQVSPSDAKRRLIWQAVERLTRENNRPAESKEVQAATKLPPSTVHYHLQRLEQQGCVQRVYGGRGIALLKAPPTYS